jgi:D-alanyl-D-alanine-carboxypeptidase/D-alanyl-D-alanine-endopeptidase
MPDTGCRMRDDHSYRLNRRRATAAWASPVAILLGVISWAAGQPAPAAARIVRLDGSTIDADSLTRRMEELTRAANVQGLTVTVFNEARIVYSHAFGFGSLPDRRPLRLDTELYGASLSKAVFAVLVMKLVEQGVVDLDTPLQTYVKEPLWRNQGKAWHEDLSELRDDPRHQRITARMSLSHTTGFPNWRWFEPDRKLRIKFEPGTRYGYSGEGMTFLQVVLEKVTGKPLETLMRDHIFGPYGMNTSSYTWQARFEKDYAVGHHADGTTYPKDKDNAARAPSTLETTTEDYARFMEAVLRRDGLSERSWNELFRPQVRIRFRTQFGPGATEETDANDDIELSYGLGWGLLRTPHGWGAFKEGHGDGFQHYAIVFPEKKCGVLLMSNSDNAESIFDRLLAVTMADTYTPLEWEGYVPYDKTPKATGAEQ